MPFKKGQPKIAGRKKGTPNKKTTELKKLSKDFSLLIREGLEPHMGKLDDYLKELPTHHRVKLMVELLKIIMPKNVNANVQVTEKAQVFEIEGQVIEF